MSLMAVSWRFVVAKRVKRLMMMRMMMMNEHRRRKLLKSGRAKLYPLFFPPSQSPPSTFYPFHSITFPSPLTLLLFSIPFPSFHRPAKRPLKSHCKLPSGIWGGTPAANAFGTFWGHKIHLVTTVRIVKLKQILLHKRWQLICFI